MDGGELDRTTVTLKAAIAEARLRLAAADWAVEPDVRDIIRYAREMHGLLLDALRTSDPLAAAQHRWIADSTGQAVDELETLITR